MFKCSREERVTFQDILIQCWNYAAKERPTLRDISGMLERLPKKRLGRSPSFPVSRSYESVFWIIIHQMVMRWFLLYVFDASLCSLLSFPPFFSVLWILLYWLYFKLLLSLQGPLLTFCYHYCVSSFTDNSKIQINRNFTINERLP